MTFNGFCKRHNVNPAERDALAFHLASLRARRTYEMLRPSAQALVIHKHKAGLQP